MIKGIPGYRRWVILALIAIALIFAVVSLTMRNPYNLTKYRMLLAKGEYELCRAEISRLLEKRPDWYEGIAFLVEVEFKAKNYTAAINHVAALSRAGWDVSELEKPLIILPMTYIPDILSSLDYTDPWSQVFALRLVMNHPPSELMVEPYTVLNNHQPNHQLLREAVIHVINSKHYLLAWRLSEISGEYEIVLRRLYELKGGIVFTDLEDVEHPELDALRCFFALYSPDFLFKLENTGFQPLIRDQYALAKLDYLYRKQLEVGPEQLSFIEPMDILNQYDAFPEQADFLATAVIVQGFDNPELVPIFSQVIGSRTLLILPDFVLREITPERLWQQALDWQRWGEREADKRKQTSGT